MTIRVLALLGLGSVLAGCGQSSGQPTKSDTAEVRTDVPTTADAETDSAALADSAPDAGDDTTSIADIAAPDAGATASDARADLVDARADGFLLGDTTLDLRADTGADLTSDPPSPDAS